MLITVLHHLFDVGLRKGDSCWTHSYQLRTSVHYFLRNQIIRLSNWLCWTDLCCQRTEQLLRVRRLNRRSRVFANGPIVPDMDSTAVTLLSSRESTWAAEPPDLLLSPPLREGKNPSGFQERLSTLLQHVIWSLLWRRWLLIHLTSAFRSTSDLRKWVTHGEIYSWESGTSVICFISFKIRWLPSAESIQGMFLKEIWESLASNKSNSSLPPNLMCNNLCVSSHSNKNNQILCLLLFLWHFDPHNTCDYCDVTPRN